MSSLHAIDLDDDQVRDYLVSVLRANDPASRMLGEPRARALVDALYGGIRAACEDLEPLVADLRLRAADSEREIARSEARRAVLEIKLGIAPPAIPGEVIP